MAHHHDISKGYLIIKGTNGASDLFIINVRRFRSDVRNLDGCSYFRRDVSCLWDKDMWISFSGDRLVHSYNEKHWWTSLNVFTDNESVLPHKETIEGKLEGGNFSFVDEDYVKDKGARARICDQYEQ